MVDEVVIFDWIELVTEKVVGIEVEMVVGDLRCACVWGFILDNPSIRANTLEKIDFHGII